MSFVLPLKSPPGTSLRRVGVKQLAQALRHLTPENGQPDVHQARKCFKRFRSLLLLAKPALEWTAFERYNVGARDVARCFASARDRQAMVETIAKIEADGVEQKVRGVLGALKAELQKIPDPAPAVNERGQSRALADLLALKREFRSERISVQDFDGLKGGLIAVYDKGRVQARQLRGRPDAPDESLHDWRKSVQRHWRHLQLLSACWPDMMREQIKLARGLSQILGDDHDLSILRELALRQRGIGGSDDVTALAVFCTKRQIELRAAAEACGHRLFAEKPKALANRLAAYWECAETAREATLGKVGASAHHALTLVKS